MSLLDFIPVTLAIAAFGLRWYVYAQPRSQSPARRSWNSNVVSLHAAVQPA